MIGYIEGSILKKEEDRILILSNQIGYEVLLPTVVKETLDIKSAGDSVSLYIYFHQTERQPRPVLIGFNMEIEKEFFQFFISVEDIGPLKVVKAMTMPVKEIAKAIELKDIKTLKRLKGIGNRTAQKIIATLSGKMSKFAMILEKDVPKTMADEGITEQVLRVLIEQLGYKSIDANKMINQALIRDPSIETPEQLFDEIFMSEQNK
jgi:Holliday junction DNA helicase RuvA